MDKLNKDELNKVSGGRVTPDPINVFSEGIPDRKDVDLNEQINENVNKKFREIDQALYKKLQ